MPTRPYSVVVNASNPGRLARFWAGALGWPITFEEPDEVVVEAEDDVVWGDGQPPALVFVPVPEPKAGKNRVHLDLPSDSEEAQQDTVDRLLDLGARRTDIGQRDVPWVVLADPEGNEFCVLEPREDYRGVQAIAAVVMDVADPRSLAGFWAEATGWQIGAAGDRYAWLQHPTAPATRLELIASADPKSGKNRLHIDVAPPPDGDLDAEVGRLETAGARRIDVGQGDVPWVVLADPEGNEFCVLTPR